MAYYPMAAAPTMTMMPMASYTYAAPMQSAPMMMQSAPMMTQAAPVMSPMYSAPVMAAPTMVQAAALTYPAAAPTFNAPAAPVMMPSSPSMPASPFCGSGFSSPFNSSSASSAATLAGMKAFHETNLKNQLNALEDTRRTLEFQMSMVNPNLSGSPTVGKAAAPRQTGTDDATTRKINEIETTIHRLMGIIETHADTLKSHQNRLKELDKKSGGS